ncbi:MAG: mandelate racemase/muconate lactonizing enzyme family protein [Rhizobiaceae bacterium]
MQVDRTKEELGFSRALTLSSVDLYPLCASGGVSPSMALGTMSTRPALVISLSDTQGCIGWGEVWANFPPRANIHKQHLIEDVVAPKLDGFIFTDPREVNAYLRETLGIYFLHIGQERVFDHILAGLDTALWDLALRSAGRSFSEHMGVVPSAPCYASSINPEDLEAKFEEHSGFGQDAFKLKLGFGDDEDFAFVERAHAQRPGNGRLMVDSNQKWTPERATNMLGRLEDFDLLFAEEPISANAQLKMWEKLANKTRIPLAAGENIYGAADSIAMANAGVQYLQPDVAKWSGVSGALDLAAMLPSTVKLWPHFMGSAVGQMAALSVAAAVGCDSVCEMDVNINSLRTDLCGDTLSIVRGAVPLLRNPGLVVPPEPEVLKAFAEPSH